MQRRWEIISVMGWKTYTTEMMSFDIATYITSTMKDGEACSFLSVLYRTYVSLSFYLFTLGSEPKSKHSFPDTLGVFPLHLDLLSLMLWNHLYMCTFLSLPSPFCACSVLQCSWYRENHVGIGRRAKMRREALPETNSDDKLISHNQVLLWGIHFAKS